MITYLGKSGQILRICDYTLFIFPIIHELWLFQSQLNPLEELAGAVAIIPHEVLHAVNININTPLSLLKLLPETYTQRAHWPLLYHTSVECSASILSLFSAFFELLHLL